MPLYFIVKSTSLPEVQHQVVDQTHDQLVLCRVGAQVEVVVDEADAVHGLVECGVQVDLLAWRRGRAARGVARGGQRLRAAE